jgi:hypothetical protein
MLTYVLVLLCKKIPRGQWKERWQGARSEEIFCVLLGMQSTLDENLLADR